MLTALVVGAASVPVLPSCFPASAWAAERSDLPDMELPPTPRGRVLWSYKTGGRAVRQGASRALVGTDADVSTFLDELLPLAQDEDNRFSLFAALPLAGRAVREGVGIALAGGSDAVSAFLGGGFENAALEDLRVEVFSELNNGGTAVRREAANALRIGTEVALRQFLDSERYSAQTEDDRVETFTILATASPQVAVYARRALSAGSPEEISWFLESGQFIARVRDEEAATIEQLVAIVEEGGRRAALNSEKAVLLSDKAVSAAEQAKAAAEEAEAEARAAENDVERSARAASKAAAAARGAASAASRATSASRAAEEASRRAARASQSAAAAAATTGRAAARAYRASIAASADASKASAARQAAEGARDAAIQARSAAAAAGHAATAANNAGAAGAAAASAANNAAAAASASAAAAVAAGAAQSEAAEARQAAAEATALAEITMRAAATAQNLARRSASAARIARDAAESAADHAEAAADAAEDAADHAGEAIDFANRSTARAEAAVEAAERVAEAVAEARSVEEAARAAESERLAQETDTAIAMALRQAGDEAERADQVNAELSHATRLTEQILSLIGRAETALQENRTGEAVADARAAGVMILDSATGAWTRQAAEFALSGGEQDVLNWIESDRVLAQQQDDREAVASIAKMSSVVLLGEAAQTVIDSESADDVAGFLNGGWIEAAAEENRFTIFQVLSENPGRAVREAAQAALADGSPEALNECAQVGLARAQQEDESVEVFRLLDVGGPYTRSAAEVALRGPAGMRSTFITGRGQHHAAQMDHDHASHVSSIRAAIAGAAKVAAEAQEDAAKASEAAAVARKAAAEASQWASRARGHADDASEAASQASDHASDAEASAAAAKESADTARLAADVAGRSVQRANYHARQAAASASLSVSYASSARTSATNAWAAARQAAVDSGAAEGAAQVAGAAAARAAWLEELERRRALLPAQLDADVERSREMRDQGIDPTIDENSRYQLVGLWPNHGGTYDPAAAADMLSYLSTLAGDVAYLLPGRTNTVLSLISLGFQGEATYHYGRAYGWQSDEFFESFGSLAINGVLTGVGLVDQTVLTQTASLYLTVNGGTAPVRSLYREVGGFLGDNELARRYYQHRWDVILPSLPELPGGEDRFPTHPYHDWDPTLDDGFFTRI